MGIIRENAIMLCDARIQGASFERVVTLGRQALYLDAASLRELAETYDVKEYEVSVAGDSYADGFFKTFLKTSELVSIDVSAYQGASIIHDMNQPIPKELKERFDAVVDGGTLEHIFNFPVVIANCMDMLRLGGKLYIITPANNFFGHGFYQFSPELFYRVLCPANGFEIERMIAVEFRSMAAERGAVRPYYEVRDPDNVRSRVTVINNRPILLMIQARKTARENKVLKDFPQQSDYAAQWVGTYADKAEERRRLWMLAFRKNAMLRLVGDLVRSMYEKATTHSLKKKRHFTPIELPSFPARRKKSWTARWRRHTRTDQR